MPLAKRKVLVTGCCGLTGRTLVAALLGAGYTVVGADILPRAAGNEALEGRALYLTCDVSSADHVYAVFEKAGPFHAVFHTAAIVPFNLVWSGSAELLRAVNVEGTRNIVEAASDSAVRHLVFASSSGVAFTGKSDLDLADESVTPAGPLNDEYSQSKADAEKVVLAASSPDKLACVALRPNGEPASHSRASGLAALDTPARPRPRPRSYDHPLPPKVRVCLVRRYLGAW